MSVMSCIAKSAMHMLAAFRFSISYTGFHYLPPWIFVSETALFRSCWSCNKRTAIIYSGNTHVTDLANLLKKYQVQSSLSSVVQSHIQITWGFLH